MSFTHLNADNWFPQWWWLAGAGTPDLAETMVKTRARKQGTTKNTRTNKKRRERDTIVTAVIFDALTLCEKQRLHICQQVGVAPATVFPCTDAWVQRHAQKALHEDTCE
jgi:hypothetical protein